MSGILSKTAKLMLVMCVLWICITLNTYAQGDGCPPDGTTGSTCPWTTAQIGSNYLGCPLYLEICFRCCEGRVEYYVKRRTFVFNNCIPDFSTLSDYQAFELAIDYSVGILVIDMLQRESPPCITSMPECLDEINCTPGAVYMATFNAPCKIWVLATRNDENGVPTQYADLVTCESSVLCKAEYRVCKTLGNNYCRKLVSSYTPVIPTTCSTSIPQIPAPINAPSPFDRCFSSGCVFNP